MDRLVPRHRRKAGSGPPAHALIAWIGTDPYLREAAATASYQREIALPLPSRIRSAKMAVVACFVLACGAVLGITTIISHGRGAVPNQAAQGRIGASAPVGITPMQADRVSPGSSAVSPADQRTGDQADTSQGPFHSGKPTAAAPPSGRDNSDDPDDRRGSGGTDSPIGLPAAGADLPRCG